MVSLINGYIFNGLFVYNIFFRRCLILLTPLSNIDVMKELNGVGELDNSVMSETWSSRVATTLFEEEQMRLIANMPDFDITNYDVDGGDSLGAKFKAIVERMKVRLPDQSIIFFGCTMILAHLLIYFHTSQLFHYLFKSRGFRKVNRDVFIVNQKGYDTHSENAVNDVNANFNSANSAMSTFIDAVKSQGIWNSTVIIMGSDFGRSINPNSNGGTDHA